MKDAIFWAYETVWVLVWGSSHSWLFFPGGCSVEFHGRDKSQGVWVGERHLLHWSFPQQNLVRPFCLHILVGILS